MTKPPRIFISSGEVSGDVIGAGLAEALLRQQPGAALYGLGGSRMSAAGVHIEFDTNQLSCVGVTEPLAVIPGLTRAFRKIHRAIRHEKPDVAVLIGNDVFNVLLSRWLKTAGIPTVAYFPPQVWLWRSLAGVIARSFDSILTCFPIEHRVYTQAGGAATFVGHFLCDLLNPVEAESRSQARLRCGLEREGQVLGLMPGSRGYEIDALTPMLLDTAAELSRADRSLQFILPVAENCFEDKIRAWVQERRPECHVVLTRDNHAAMKACDLVLVASGTATLEAGLLGLPMVILYRVSPVTYGVVKLLGLTGLIDSETVGLPNLLLGKMVVPELRQSRAARRDLARLARSILQDKPLLNQMRRDLAQLATRLSGEGSHDKAARHILSWLPDGRFPGAGSAGTLFSRANAAPVCGKV